MVKKILIISFLLAAAPPLAGQGLLLSPDTAFAATQENGQPCPPECVTDSMEIVTWYPSPYNEYEELRLYPTQRDAGDCNNDKIGLMYYDHGGTPSFPDNDKMMICKGTLLGWQEVGGEGFWKFADSSTSDIYYTKSGNVGIGTDSPSAKLEVTGTIKTQGFKMPTGAQAGYVLTVDASGNASWQSPAGGSSFSNIVPYNTPGTYSFAVPSGVTQVMVEVFGAGGGGGGDYFAGDSSGMGGGGGGGGGYGKGIFSVTSGQNYSVVVGAGGVGGNSGKMNCGGNCAGGGAAGEASSFGTLISASGGQGGGPGSNSCGTLSFGYGGTGGDGGMSSASINAIGDKGETGSGCGSAWGKGGRGAIGAGSGGDGVEYTVNSGLGGTGGQGKVVVYY